MRFDEKIIALKNRIEEALLPLVDNDYVLWGLPYHGNIGDILIWTGEEIFLQKTGFKCLERTSINTCKFPELSPEIIIFLEGGGDFGDVWREVQLFRLEVIKRYPDNRIIIFPETVFYKDSSLMRYDAEIMSLHRKLTICVRDKKSEDLLKLNFKNSILLVPDMAFEISCECLCPKKKDRYNRILFLKRTDKEAVYTDNVLKHISGNVDIRDWPSMEHMPFVPKIFFKFCGLQLRLKKYRYFSFWAFLLGKIIDKCMYSYVRPYLLGIGVNFVGDYSQVYTTRLHVLILSVLLHKEVKFIDNSYGKNTAFYETWLKDLPMVQEIILNE